MKKIQGYYFATRDKSLRYGDGRTIAVGETHSVEGEIVLCENGLHMSRKPLDALSYTPGPVIYGVEVFGDIVEGGDKVAARNRTYLWELDAEDLLRRFARKCALDVIHLWDAPDVVVRYLKTGDESLRDAARDAAWAAASAAARDAAWATARDAARDAASAAARDAAWAAASAAARDAAWATARDAARDAAWAAASVPASAAAWATTRDAAEKKQNRRMVAMIAHERRATA